MSNNKLTSIRLSPEADQLRKLLAKKLGLSKTAVFELAIRKLAEIEKVQRQEGDKEDGST